jgi:plastocyanin
MEDLTVSLKAAAPVRRASATFSILAVLAGLLAVSGCGSSSKSSSSSSSSSTPAAPATSSSTTPSTPAAAGGGAGHTLSISANPEGQLKYSTSTLTAKSGKVSITFTNTASLSHNLTVASSSGAQVGATETFQGGSKTLSLNLTPGVYKFFCTVPGHRAAGMEGTLTVQ